MLCVLEERGLSDAAYLKYVSQAMHPVRWLEAEYPECFFEVECEGGEQRALVEAAARRGVLVHGVYEVLLEMHPQGDDQGDDQGVNQGVDQGVERVVDRAVACIERFRGRCFSLTTCVPAMPLTSNPHLAGRTTHIRSALAQTHLSSPSDTHEDHHGDHHGDKGEKGDSGNEEGKEGDECVKYQVFCASNASHTMMLTRQLVRGVAAPLYTNGRDPLPSPTAQRRPLGGILNRLAVKRVPHPSATYLEPELALLLASLAHISEGSVALDPFCGMGSLLIAAASRGAVALGVDVCMSEEAAGRVIANTKALGMPAPVALFEGRAEVLADPTQGSLVQVYGSDATLLLGEGCVDAILTDPPYGMREPVLLGKSAPCVDTTVYDFHCAYRGGGGEKLHGCYGARRGER